MATESSYEQVVEALRTACKAVVLTGGAQKFYVRRGPIDWPSFRFDLHPYAIAIHDADSDLDDLPGLREGMLQLHMMTTLPVESDGVTDDAVIYSLRRDAQAIIGALRIAKIGDQPQHSAAQKVLRPRAALAFDLDAGVQGLVVTFAIGYFQGN